MSPEPGTVTRTGQIRTPDHLGLLASGEQAHGIGSTDPPRVLFRRVCEAVSARMEQHGFRYRKAEPGLIRPALAGKNGVSFRTTTYNKRGVLVKLELYAGVETNGLWIVAGPALGSVARPDDRVAWNLAASQDEPATVEEIASYLEHHALPWFALFDEPKGLRDRLLMGGVEAPEGAEAVDWLAAYGFDDVIPAYVDAFLESHPRWLPRVRAELVELAADSGRLATSPVSQPNVQLARAIVRAGIDASTALERFA